MLEASLGRSGGQNGDLMRLCIYGQARHINLSRGKKLAPPKDEGAAKRH